MSDKIKVPTFTFKKEGIKMGQADKEVLDKKIERGLRAEKRKKKKAMKKEMKARKESFWNDFKKFITKGNVIDLAVGVVIGSAFSAITNGLVKFIINPCIAILTGGISLDEWKTVLRAEVLEDVEKGIAGQPEVAILWGQWVQTIIQFFIIALSVFTAVRIIKGVNNRLQAKQLAAAAEAAKAKAEADAAAAAEAKAIAEAKEAQLQAFYANVEKQTELLEKLANK